MTRTPVLVSGAQRIYVGIDPGLSGVIATMDDVPGRQLEIETNWAPTLTVLKGARTKKKTATKIVYDLQAMLALLAPLRGRRVIAGLEELSGYPGQSSQSVFGMGRALGLWEMALTAHQIPFVRVRPQVWKKAMNVMGKPGQDDTSRKAESVLKAQELFPWLKFPLVKDHNRADAVLLAEYMRRIYPL